MLSRQPTWEQHSHERAVGTGPVPVDSTLTPHPRLLATHITIMAENLGSSMRDLYVLRNAVSQNQINFIEIVHNSRKDGTAEV